jgi:hypothetical protein
LKIALTGSHAIRVPNCAQFVHENFAKWGKSRRKNIQNAFCDSSKRCGTSGRQKTALFGISEKVKNRFYYVLLLFVVV